LNLTNLISSYLTVVRKHGIEQFLNTYNRVKDRSHDELKWGDEIEYHLIELCPELRETRISLTAPETLAKLAAESEELSSDKSAQNATKLAWHPEYGSWMVEATPGVPYGNATDDLCKVEANMALRRARIHLAAGAHTSPFSIVAYPFLGVGNFTSPQTAVNHDSIGPFSYSSYINDSIISPHPRFGTLTANIRTRRGRKIDIQVPLYIDSNTVQQPITILPESVVRHIQPSFDESAASASSSSGSDNFSTIATRRYTSARKQAEEKGTLYTRATEYPLPSHVPSNFIHMDAMAFGMGACCLQVTFQARDLDESRYLYDTLHVLSPILMALTANSPVWRGHLANTDTRWDVISASVDCRTPYESSKGSENVQLSEAIHDSNDYWMNVNEHAPNAAAGGKKQISKSRYSSIDTYIYNGAIAKEKYNDIPCAYDEEAFSSLLASGLDEKLAKHIAHLFIRDPLVIFRGRIKEVDDQKSSEHFENIQSTNWRSMRWKPPPPDSPSMGWRVEFRTMEVQLTDFENAAFTVFVVLLSRVAIFFSLNLYVPLSKVDENFHRAKEVQAASKQKFYFRKRISELSGHSSSPENNGEKGDEDDDEIEEMSIKEILLGSSSNKQGAFPGLIPLIFTYLDMIACDSESRLVVDNYLRFVASRATEESMTGATWQRKFIMSHPEYQHDSVVTHGIVFDMLQKIDSLVHSQCDSSDLLGVHAPTQINLSPEQVRKCDLSSVSRYPPFRASAADSAGLSTSGRQDRPAGRPGAVKLRGRSYAEEVKESSAQSMLIRALIERYTVKDGRKFEDTTPFLV
jgi:glutamate--cysteine ligase catalytic subunit